jgi:hypothetical protein
MASGKSSIKLSPINIAWLALGLFVLINVALSLLNLLHKPFNPDELQHLHIAWLISQGEIIYRDFWEHHGALYGLLNGALMYLVNPAPSASVLIWFRVLSLVATLGVMVMVWLMARELSLSRLGSLLAVAAYASLYIVQSKGVEMRPDALQNLFWVIGLYLLIRNQSGGSFGRAVGVGALFALAILSNAKAGIGPLFVVIFYILGRWLCGLTWSHIRRDVGGILTGGCLAVLPFLIYFWIHDAVGDFFYFTTVWNVFLNYYWITMYGGGLPQEEVSLGMRELQFFLRDQLPFLLLTAAGAIFWVRRLLHSKQAARQRDWLFFIATTGTSLGWLLGQHAQFFLIFLPFWSILAAYALLAVARVTPGNNLAIGIVTSSLIAIVAGLGMLWYSVGRAPLREVPLLTQQKEFTRKIVTMTEREEPIASTWSNCGGYMFNRNVSFYWVAMPVHSEIIEAISGEHPFEQSFIDTMEDQQVRYLIGIENWMTEGLSDNAKNYLRANFDYSPCLWTRREL